MKVVSSTVAPFPPPLKMEDRKRSAAQNVDDLAPPTKRQAVNGASKTSADSDMPWKDDLEVSVTRPPDPFPIFSLPSLCTRS
jgi:E3 ubiquitin-protein ligase BRE1